MLKVSIISFFVVIFSFSPISNLAELSISEETLELKKEPCVFNREISPFSEEYRRYLTYLELRYDLPSDILFIMMIKESGGTITAISPVGAQGLFQFMPRTAYWLQIDPFDPYQAATGAAIYLRYLLNHFNQDLQLGIAAYNAGMGTVRRYQYRIPPYEETQRYVAGILAELEENSL